MTKKAGAKGKTAEYLAVVLILIVLIGVVKGPTTPPSPYSPAIRASAMQSARQIGVCLSQYAKDHNGQYPEGKTSTEVFQKLIDEKYVEDPNIFYVWKLAKVRPQGTQLKPENVGWDVTCCVDSSAPRGLPVVFMTGFKVSYQAAAQAEPIDHPPKTWSRWWHGPDVMKKFIAVSYTDGFTKAIIADADGSIPNFIPADFDPKGKTYRQRTP